MLFSINFWPDIAASEDVLSCQTFDSNHFLNVLKIINISFTLYMQPDPNYDLPYRNTTINDILILSDIQIQHIEMLLKTIVVFDTLYF